MAAKKQTDRSLILSKENFSKFTKLTEDNISEFYYKKSIIIVYDVINNILIHSFNGREAHKGGLNHFHYLYDGSISKSSFRCVRNETNDEYNESMSNFYPYIKEQIKLGRLYAIKI